jgi:uncharacterized protein (DUF58 family)
MAQSQQTFQTMQPQDVAAIDNLYLRARLIVEGTIAGMRRSPYHGFSTEFSEYRAYRTGESTRHIDWRKLAKSDRSVVRLFKDETNLRAHILLDCSSSMDFSSADTLTKFNYARTLGAALCWLLVHQRDAVGLALYNQSVSGYLPPRSTSRHLSALLAQIDQCSPQGHTATGSVLQWLTHTESKRGLCIVISDLHEGIETLQRGLRHAACSKKECIVVRVLDPMELDLSHDNNLKMIDMESQRQIFVDPHAAAHDYPRAFERHSRALHEICRGSAARLITLTTTTPFATALQTITRMQ